MPCQSFITWTPVDISPTTVSVAIVTVFLSGAFFHFRSTRGLPPGPIGVPFLGYWPFISTTAYPQQFDELKRKYGNVFSFWCTGKLYINLGSRRAIREAHISLTECFTKRTDEFSLLNSTFPDSVGTTHGESWKVTRKFFVQVMKDRMSSSLKGSLYESIRSAVDELKTKNDDAINIVEFLAEKSFNILQLTLFDDSNRQAIRDIVGCYARMTTCFTARNLLATGNLARYIIFPRTPGYKKRVFNLKRIQKILYEIIEDHTRTYDENHTRDIFDEYIKERSTRQRKGDPTAKYFTDKVLMSTLVQVIGDGVVLTSAFICHFIETLLAHPEEQEKIFKELMQEIGPGRQPDIQDKSRLTYTNAFIQEAQRTMPFSSFFPSLECTKETSLSGYRIPKGAITVLNVYSANHDPESYPDPHKFDPSRFIVKEGKRKSEPVIQFGVGKRSCVGESFVMLQLFLLFTTLVKNIRFLPPPEGAADNSSQLFQRGRMRVRVEPRN